MRIAVALVIGVLIGTLGMWFAGSHLGAGRTAAISLSSSAAGASSSTAGNGISGKFSCKLEMYEFKPDGTLYVTLTMGDPSAHGPTTAGTYTIDGDRIVMVINGRSEVHNLQRGMFTYDGSGRDCAKL